LCTFVWNAAMTAAGCTLGMLRCTRLNLYIYLRKDSPSLCGITCRSLG
jgi:hypothetical protein